MLSIYESSHELFCACHSLLVYSAGTKPTRKDLKNVIKQQHETILQLREEVALLEETIEKMGQERRAVHRKGAEEAESPIFQHLMARLKVCDYS